MQNTAEILVKDKPLAVYNPFGEKLKELKEWLDEGNQANKVIKK